VVLGKFVKPEPISLQELVELKVLCCCHDIVQDHACMALNPELFSAETGGHGHCRGMMPLAFAAAHHVEVITTAADVVPQLIGHGTRLL